MKNKIKFLIFLFSYFLIFLLTGCQLEENYVTEYGFSNELVTEQKVEVSGDAVYLEIPFADFSCDSKSFKLLLDRNKGKKEIVLTLQGTETQERCSQKFYANISGIKSGTYWLKVIYKKAGDDQQVLYQQFTVSK